jgi:integrative and conjugative element protein (TIGR02256 family)
MQISLIRLWIAEQALTRMVSDADSFFPNETGGVLMGYWAANEVVITDSIRGGPLAQRTPTRFLPDHSYQARAIEEIYNSSGGSHSYLGDWHTHPRGRLALSPTDVLTLRRIAKHREARVASPIMMLLAGDHEWSARAWCWRPKRRIWNCIQDCAIQTYSS